MLIVIFACVMVIALTTLIHFEILSSLNTRLPTLSIPSRSKLLIVIFAAFTAHALEIALYGFVLFGLIHFTGTGSLSGIGSSSLENCLYFSAETFSSLGFGDLIPNGPIRLLAGTEALNGLLLIGWSASYAYLAMERFWGVGIPDGES
ncbi:ion channel [Polaromonas sp.]|uniref:ion channel n=1 Tax=Polaromonas sp. TaxID=1869339 RepID=UPI0013B6177C|nr:ion channel [Polaromonas sp.]NDP62730.1 two pore domain potassium channel family protein [Polaromonas sp.]